MCLQEALKNIIENNLYDKSRDDLVQLRDNNKEILDNINNACQYLKIQDIKSLSYVEKIKRLYVSFIAFDNVGDFDTLCCFIEEFCLDKKGEVSPNILNMIAKLNPLIEQRILLETQSFPVNMTLMKRCKLIRHGIRIYPLCKNCGINHVSSGKYSLLSKYCSKKCWSTCKETREKTEKTCIERYGNKCFFRSNVGIEKIKTFISGIDEDYYEKNQIKSKQTKKERYGDENYVNLEKKKQTCLLRYGNEHYVKTDDFKEKSEKTLMKNYGVTHGSQSDVIFKKQQQSLFAIKQFKSTHLTYQGKYELYFLELIENINMLNCIKHPDGLSYFFDGKQHVYHPDYEFVNNGLIIEIKSAWTYNRHGKDLILQAQNESKWQAVKNLGKEIIILFSKKEIKEFVDNLEII